LAETVPGAASVTRFPLRVPPCGQELAAPALVCRACLLEGIECGCEVSRRRFIRERCRGVATGSRAVFDGLGVTPGHRGLQEVMSERCEVRDRVRPVELLENLPDPPVERCAL